MKRIALVIMLGVALAACGAAAEPRSTADDYDGEWTLVEGRGPDGPIDMAADHPITLELGDGRVRGSAGCNGYQGPVEINGSQFHAEGFSMTEIGCTGKVMRAEGIYADALSHAIKISRRGPTLRLEGPHVVLRYRFVPPPSPANLIGTPWRLDTIFVGTTSDGSAMSTTPATLQLSSDGSMAGTTGCRSFDAQWSRDGDVVRVNGFKVSGRCSRQDRYQDRSVVDVLDSDFSFAIEGRSLRVSATDKDRGLGYSAE